MEIIEEARAKINLTLKVLGRLENGYHSLHSLVAFANISDRIQFIPGSKFELNVCGPFAKDLKGQNLLEKIIVLLKKRYPEIVLGHVTLEKNLPVASGMGGGSADAAALLLAIIKANPNIPIPINFDEIASQVGADVSVCLKKQALWMSGVGDQFQSLKKPLPPLPVLLVNPMVSVPSDKTTQVFKLLDAPEVKNSNNTAPLFFPSFATKKELLSFIRESGNDLLPGASRLVPVIRKVLDVLQMCDGNEVSSLTGAGPTCYGIFENEHKTEWARIKIGELQPSWWVRGGTLS